MCGREIAAKKLQLNLMLELVVVTLLFFFNRMFQIPSHFKACKHTKSRSSSMPVFTVKQNPLTIRLGVTYKLHKKLCLFPCWLAVIWNGYVNYPYAWWYKGFIVCAFSTKVYNRINSQNLFHPRIFVSVKGLSGTVHAIAYNGEVP